MEALGRSRRIEGEGTPESSWQAWPILGELDEIILDEWLPVDTRLVVVAPHPDDEILACGGLMQLHAGRGGEILVVAVTDGERSHGEIDSPAKAELARVRVSESSEGLSRLGLGNVAAVRLGLPDGGVHVDRLVAELARVLRPTDLAVATWVLDGHPDHEATGSAAADACAARHCRLAQAPVWMWHWAAPDDPRVPWRRLRRLPIPAPVHARKVHALAAHATQLEARDGLAGPVLGDAMLERLARRHEYFFDTVGACSP